MTQIHGYNFYFDIPLGNGNKNTLPFPITPSELTIKVGSNNKVVTLINEGDINVLKSPSLVEIEFEARFPMRQYPYAREFSNFQNYWDTFKELKEKKKWFEFIVIRTTPNGVPTWDTTFTVALEEFELKESVDEGDDVLIAFKLKQYKTYGVKVQKLPNKPSTTTSTSDKSRDTGSKGTESSVYTVKSGDCLWNIAKAAYGSGTKEKTIYEANKSVIESTAKKRGYKSSRNGWWIFPGTKLTLPGVKNAGSLNVKKLK